MSILELMVATLVVVTVIQIAIIFTQVLRIRRQSLLVDVMQKNVNEIREMIKDLDTETEEGSTNPPTLNLKGLFKDGSEHKGH